METIDIRGGFTFDVEFDYTPAKLTDDFYDPESLEITTVQFDGNMVDLFDDYPSWTQILDAIGQRIRDTH